MLTLPRTKNSTGNLHPDLMRTLASHFRLEAFVETGTYMGDTTASASTLFPIVHTIELSDTLAAKARQRFASKPGVQVHCGDSANLLAHVVGQLRGPTLFWLDGHYSEGVTALGSQNTPIREELQIVATRAPKGSLILIDDLRLFDDKASEPSAPASMHGYPSLNEIYSDLSLMDYQMFVLGDVALATPKTIDFTVSPVVQALTISRLYDGSNLDIEEVLAAESIITNSEGEERSVISEMAAPYLATEQYGLGLHYRFWRALTIINSDPVQAGKDLVEVSGKGFPHWRLRWYLALILNQGGETTVAQELVREILIQEPDFAAGRQFLASASVQIPEAAQSARPTLVAERPLLDQLVAFNIHRDGQPVRLHLGCGEQHFPGYINIDYPPSEHTCQTQIGADVFGDITKIRLPEGGLSEIRLHHVFEHFQRSEALALLILWHEGLGVGGRLHIETPDVEGCARQLASNISFQMKQAVLRHCFGSQEASWAIHYDGWSEAKYHHVLGKLGFTVQTLARSWPHPPHLANVEAIATKTRTMSRKELLSAADQLLAEYMVADVPSERTMCEVWRKALRDFLNARTALSTIFSKEGVANAAASQKKSDSFSSSGADRIHAVIFSKDRALQLDATLRSFFTHCRDAAQVTLNVLYATSDTSHQAQYEQLAAQNPQVVFVPETNFRADLLALVEKPSDILLLVDDNLFTRPFRLEVARKALADHPQALGFSLRLGRNTTYCYPFDKPQAVPPLKPAGDDIVSFRWIDAELDFGYPLEVSSSLYRARELFPLLRTLDYKNPNTLEQKLSENARSLGKMLPLLLCFDRSVTFCNPVNKVQTVISQNRAGTQSKYSAEALARKFDAGERIDVSSFIGHVPRGCHEEVALVFIAQGGAAGSHSGKGAPSPIRVSVIITCYNYGRYLRECVRSVASQTYKDFELIIVNDGSTDESQNVAEACVVEFPAVRITVVNQPNSGQPALARNAGIRRARGEFILPLDADDRITPTYLQDAFKAIDADPSIDLVYADSLFDDGKREERKKPGKFEVRALSSCNQLVYCCVYRRSLWEKIGGYRDNVRGYEDWDFWVAASLAGARGAYIPVVGLLYNEKEGGVFSQTLAHHNARCAQLILNNPGAYTATQIQKARETLGCAGKIFSSPAAAAFSADPLASERMQQEPNLVCFQQAMEQAEQAVRDQRLQDAVTCVEKALSCAPDAESNARAAEIKNLLLDAQRIAGIDHAPISSPAIPER